VGEGVEVCVEDHKVRGAECLLSLGALALSVKGMIACVIEGCELCPVGSLGEVFAEARFCGGYVRWRAVHRERGGLVFSRE
jgi:hypothetical protein